MLYYLYLFGIFLARTLPIKWFYALVTGIACVFSFFVRKDREGLAINYKVIFDGDIDEKTIDKYILRTVINFSKYLADFFKYSKITNDFFKKKIKVTGQKNIDDCLKMGKGVILVAFHIGNWEMGGAIVSALGYTLNAIVLDHKNKRINDLFVKQRESNNYKGIPLGVSIKECFKALKRNELLAIVADKDYTSGGVYVNFFGREVVMPKGPAIFALKTGAPIAFTTCIRRENDTFELVIDEPIISVPTGDTNKDVRVIIEEYLKFAEKHIRNNPDQWYEFGRIWETEKKK